MGYKTSFGANTKPGAEKQKPNVLFVVIDDLRTELGCYGNQVVQSPGIDRIADRGFTFTRAYAQYPLCGPSRCSFLTGLRPTRERFASNMSMVDKETGKIPTFPEHFKNNGYYTISNGKIFHDHGNVIDGMDGWSELPWEPHPGFWVWKAPENRKYTYKGYRYRRGYEFGPSFEAANVPDDAYPTGLITSKTIHDLRRLKNIDQPFFLAVGYRKPHLPLNAPQKYWDLYSDVEFELAENFSKYTDIPAEAFHNSGELRSYSDIPDTGEIAKNIWLKLIQGYYACISYTDHQINVLLDELERLHLDDETIIVLIGDHGYQLSDHGMWSKATNFHQAVLSPLIISLPESKDRKIINFLIEFVDVYPTVAELCGLDIPVHIQGKSFAPLITDRKDYYRSKKAAYSREGDGETVITEKYIYTEWINDDGVCYQKMLFNLEKDPLEKKNLAGSEMFSEIQKRLSILLQEKSKLN